MGHEATVSKVSDDQLFYLMSRGMTEDEAMAMIVRGFVEPIARGAAHGVRPRAQPADRAADGRGGRLSRRLPPAQRIAVRTTETARRRDARHGADALAEPPPRRRRAVRREPCGQPEQALARRSTSPTSPCPPAARRTGGSRRWTACAACTTARRRPATARSRSTASRARGRRAVETVGPDDARSAGGSSRPTGSRPLAFASFEPATRRHGPDGRRARPSRCVIAAARARAALRVRRHLVIEAGRLAEAIVVLDHTGSATLRRQRRGPSSATARS